MYKPAPVIYATLQTEMKTLSVATGKETEIE